MFLWIGPLFRRIGPRVSQDRTFSKTNAPIPKKHPVCTEHTSNSTLVCHGQTPPRSSPFSKTRKDSSSTRQQETRVTFSTNLAYATKRPVNTWRKELLHCTSLGYWDIQCTHSHLEHYPLLVPLEPEIDLAHTHQCCDYSLSQAAEQSGESHHVLTKLHGYGMEGKRRRIASFADTGGPRAPQRSNFDDPEGWDTSFSEEECSQQDVVQRMVPVAGRPIIMCGTSGCSGSCSLSAVENGYEAGKKPATCQTCGRIFPRPNSRNVSPVTSRRNRNTSPAMSRRSSVVSCSDSPRDQAVPKSVEAVMENCTESHQTWNETLGEQSRSQV